MPPKKGKGGTKKKQPRSSDEEFNKNIDVQHNPEAMNVLIEGLREQLDSRCRQLLSDRDMQMMSIQANFNMELIKIPTNVKKMSLSQFRKEFGESLEAVVLGTISGKGELSAAQKRITQGNSRSSMKIFQTPSHHRHHDKSGRAPVEGEKILSTNGSPLGEFQTVVKAPKSGVGMIPPTPGVYVPLGSGEVVDIDSVDIEQMSREQKVDAISKMQAMMESMQALMSKLGNGAESRS